MVEWFYSVDTKTQGDNSKQAGLEDKDRNPGKQECWHRCDPPGQSLPSFHQVGVLSARLGDHGA